MSHFTNLKTSFKNLLHLENALNKLEIPYKREKKVIEGNNSKLYNVNLVIPQSNNYEEITLYPCINMFTTSTCTKTNWWK